MPLHERHIFICTSDDCRKHGGKKVCRAFKDALDEHGLKRRVKVMEVDCFDQCAHGPMAIVYPDATWYADLNEQDAAEIVEQHLVAGKPLSRRLYKRAHKK